jgi:gas vesicle protein
MNSASRYLLAFLGGAITGAALGILYAPDEGSNTRDRLAYRLSRYRDQLQKLVADLVDARDLPDSMAKAESEKVVNEAREKAERLLADVENLMGQIKAK